MLMILLRAINIFELYFALFVEFFKRVKPLQFVVSIGFIAKTSINNQFIKHQVISNF